MIQIVLNDEQVEILNRAREPVNVVDRSGRDLGRVIPPQCSQAKPAKILDPDIAVALQRIEDSKQGKGVFYTTKEVLDHLQSLEQS
jgi:hypothetical protein